MENEPRRVGARLFIERAESICVIPSHKSQNPTIFVRCAVFAGFFYH